MLCGNFGVFLVVGEATEDHLNPDVFDCWMKEYRWFLRCWFSFQGNFQDRYSTRNQLSSDAIHPRMDSTDPGSWERLVPKTSQNPRQNSDHGFEVIDRKI